MTAQQLHRLRLSLTALVMLAEFAHLAWEHSHGGVVSHHLLNRSDLPAISNWFGAILLPALTWFLTGRIQRRILLPSGGNGSAAMFPVGIIVGFLGSLILGVLLSVAFTNGHENVASYLFGSMLLAAVLLPVYRAECVLGFVLGMTFTFGAVLPTAIGSILAALSAVIHLIFRAILLRIRPKSNRVPSATA